MPVLGKLSTTNGRSIAVDDNNLRGQNIRARLLRCDGRTFYAGTLQITMGKFINAPKVTISEWITACGRTEADVRGRRNERNTVCFFVDSDGTYSLHFAELELGALGQGSGSRMFAEVRPAAPMSGGTPTQRRLILEEEKMCPDVACGQLHELLEQLPLYGVDVNLALLPACSGIYYFYSKTGTSWEPSGHPQAPNGIIRIGISRGTRGRVSNHYHGVIPINTMSLDRFCPKDRSVMRAHIGRALLASPGHPDADCLPIWNADMTTPDKRNAYRHLRSIAVEQTIEREVSAVLARDFYFRCVACESDGEADDLETSGIGIVSSCLVCQRSQGWLWEQYPPGYDFSGQAMECG